MKKIGVYIFIAIVVIAHVIFFMYLNGSEQNPAVPTENMGQPPVTSPGDLSQENPNDPVLNSQKTEVKNETPNKASAPKDQATAPGVQSQSQKSSATGKLQPYHRGFFKVAEKPMTDALKRVTAPVRSGLVIDLDTNTIIWQKDAAGVYPIASLTKLMTSVLLMEHLEANPSESLKTKVTITPEDRKYFKSNAINGVYLDTGESYTLKEYLLCMMVASSNDCAYVVGRHIADDNISAFVSRMNKRAKEMGLNDMNFNNANGLPIKSASGRLENTGSALSVAYLALYAMQYPTIMECAGTSYYKLRADKKNPFDVHGTNKLIRGKVEGVNGLKTGYTNGAGYCIVVTCERGGKKRMILLMGVGGADRGKLRDTIAKQLLEWAYK